MKAVLLDALGTLVRLEPPAPRLRTELSARAGIEVDEPAAERAIRAEIAYYVEHHLEGRDPASLAALRDRCAGVVAGELGVGHGPAVRDALLASLRFTAFPDAAPALRALRARGVRLVVVSNWDCSLGDVLAGAGLRELLDGVVSSAKAGSAKPARAPFDEALRLAGTSAAEALHVGDSLENDVRGAARVALRGVLLARDGPPPAGVESIRSLAELPSLL